MNKNKYNKLDLEDFILIQNKSYEEIGKIYNVSGSAIRLAAIRFNIKIPIRRKINSKETFNKHNTYELEYGVCLNCGKSFVKYPSKNNIYCSCKCQLEYRHKQNYEKLINGDPLIMRANYSPIHFREDILNELGGVCAICGMKPFWNGKPLIFIVDHIDGNAANNKRDNLRCICSNCDSQLDTYKSKNKNGARSYYRYHKFKK